MRNSGIILVKWSKYDDFKYDLKSKIDYEKALLLLTLALFY